MFYEPIWVHYRGDSPVASLRDLKGMKILYRDQGKRSPADR